MKASSRSVGTNTDRSTSTRSVSTQTKKSLNKTYIVDHDDESSDDRKAIKRKSRSKNTKETPNKAAKLVHHNELDTDISMSTINERSRIANTPSSINTTTNTSKMSANLMNETTNMPMTSKSARAQSAPLNNLSSVKKRNKSSPVQEESYMHSTPSTSGSILPKKRSVQISIDTKKSTLKSSSKISRHPEDSARLRFNFSDLSEMSGSNNTTVPHIRPHLDLSSSSSHASPQIANQTDFSISEGMNRLVVKTPRVLINRNQSHHMDMAEHHESMDHSIEPANHDHSFDDNISLNLTNLARQNEAIRPQLRRSERIRLKNERLRLLAENVHFNVDLRHVTMRRNNSGYDRQQQAVKNVRRTKRA